MTATIILLAGIAAAVFFALRSIIRDHRSGIGACGEKCSDCELHCSDSSQIPERFRLKK